MENEKKINAMPYGFALVSIDTFEKCRKRGKIRAKKMLSYFDKNHEQFFDFISEGAFLPIHHLVHDRYTLFFSEMGELPPDVEKDWNKVGFWPDFSLYVDSSDSVWAVEFEEIEAWDIRKFNDVDCIKGVYYDINDEPHTDYKAIKYTVPKGIYSVDIVGLKKKVIEENRENYGFLVILNRKENISALCDPSETNFHTMFEK